MGISFRALNVDITVQVLFKYDCGERVHRVQDKRSQPDSRISTEAGMPSVPSDEVLSARNATTCVSFCMGVAETVFGKSFMLEAGVLVKPAKV